MATVEELIELNKAANELISMQDEIINNQRDIIKSCEVVMEKDDQLIALLKAKIRELMA